MWEVWPWRNLSVGAMMGRFRSRGAGMGVAERENGFEEGVGGLMESVERVEVVVRAEEVEVVLSDED